MPRIIPLRPRAIEKILIKHGFVLNHTTGSHKQYYSRKTKTHVTVPFHSKTIAKGTMMSIIRQSKLPTELFRK